MHTLDSALWIPEAQYTLALEKALTVHNRLIDGRFLSVETVCKKNGMVGLPRVFGEKYAKGKYKDNRSAGTPVRFPSKPTLRDYQKDFAAQILERTKQTGDFIVKAYTGSGKSVVALYVAAHLRRTTVVLVDQIDLVNQWVAYAQEHLKLRRSSIGVVASGKADWEGKAFVVCTIQTLAKTELPEEFYQAFGLVFVDEVHTAGAPIFSKVLTMFSAKTRIGLSATPERRDALNQILGLNLGTIDVVLDRTPTEAAVYILEHDTVYSWSANNSKMTGRYINEIASDASRNLLIIDALRWLYDSGRDVLLIGDRVQHLTALYHLAVWAGIPESDMGIYAKSTTVFVYEKDPMPVRKPSFLEPGAAYSPVRLSLVQKTIPKAERDIVKETSRIIFATYGVMAKGVDIPRLAAGIDVTPRSEAIQVFGRVLRTMPGKLKPIWVTIADINSFRSLYQLQQRIAGYTESNAGIYLWKPDKGRKRLELGAYERQLRLEIQELRRTRITTSADGRYTLQT